MTARQEKGLELLHKIIMWVAMVSLLGIVGYIFSTMRTQAMEIDKVKCVNAEQATEIAVLKTNYTHIEGNLNMILAEIKTNGRKLDRHMEKDVR